MLSDELDSKMKDATEGYRPAYDEKAWDKMEALLDKHLPLEKKRRRFIFLLLPLLLIGTGIFFMLHRAGNNVTNEEKNTITQSQPGGDQLLREATITVPSKTTLSKQAAISPIQPEVITPAAAESKPTEIKLPKQSVVSRDINNNNREKINQIISRERPFEQQTSSGKKKNSRNIKDQENNFIQRKPSERNTLITATDKDGIDNIVTPVSGDKSASVNEIVKAAEEKKQPDSSELKHEIAKAKPQKQRSSASGKFSLNFSAGPDISSIGIDNPGQWTLQYGIGVSYALSKKLSIRTGFFAGHKIYTADSTEYHSNYYPPKLQRIEANCLVYEIPVNLIYNFSALKKHNWFIAGGLSSYLMKKETYDYYYKNSWGQAQFYSHTYKNKNAHILSVINFSGGYQYHFTDRLSLMAEPYVRIPVSGIGSGKVKLNSGGVLFSLGFKPFLKRN